MIYKVKRFALIGDSGKSNMILDPKTGKYIRNPELFHNGQTAQQMADTIKSQTAMNIKADAAEAASRASRKEVGQVFNKEVTSIAKNANQKGYQAGMKAGINQGAKSVGVIGGLKNTWRNTGTMGKAGMGAAAVGGTYILGKGLGLWGNKKEE